MKFYAQVKQGGYSVLETTTVVVTCSLKIKSQSLQIWILQKLSRNLFPQHIAIQAQVSCVGQ